MVWPRCHGTQNAPAPSGAPVSAWHAMPEDAPGAAVCAAAKHPIARPPCPGETAAQATPPVRSSPAHHPQHLYAPLHADQPPHAEAAPHFRRVRLCRGNPVESAPACGTTMRHRLHAPPRRGVGLEPHGCHVEAEPALCAGVQRGLLCTLGRAPTVVPRRAEPRLAVRTDRIGNGQRLRAVLAAPAHGVRRRAGLCRVLHPALPGTECRGRCTPRRQARQHSCFDSFQRFMHKGWKPIHLEFFGVFS